MTGDEIPVIVTSTIGYLSRFALRHQVCYIFLKFANKCAYQGLFRVSGSTSEINKFKEAFERGQRFTVFSNVFLITILPNRKITTINED